MGEAERLVVGKGAHETGRGEAAVGGEAGAGDPLRRLLGEGPEAERLAAHPGGGGVAAEEAVGGARAAPFGATLRSRTIPSKSQPRP